MENNFEVFPYLAFEPFLHTQVDDSCRNVTESLEKSMKVIQWNIQESYKPLSEKTVKLLSITEQIQTTAHLDIEKNVCKVIALGISTTKEFISRDLELMLRFFDKHVNSGTFDYGIMRTIRSMLYNTNHNQMAFKDHRLYMFMYPCLSANMTKVWDSFGGTKEALESILL